MGITVHSRAEPRQQLNQDRSRVRLRVRHDPIHDLAGEALQRDRVERGERDHVQRTVVLGLRLDEVGVELGHLATALAAEAMVLSTSPAGSPALNAAPRISASRAGSPPRWYAW